MRTQTVLMIGVVGVVGYFLVKRWQDQQRAIAHPIEAPRISLQPVTFDPALVGRTF